MRLAAPTAITAAGTSAPTAIAAKAKPANQPGKIRRNSSGTTALVLAVTMPAACAISPRVAISPSSSV